jgi:hypothetical protein
MESVTEPRGVGESAAAAGARKAGIVAAKNIAGVKAVHSHVPWVDPVSGMVSDDDHDGHASGMVIGRHADVLGRTPRAGSF